MESAQLETPKWKYENVAYKLEPDFSFGRDHLSPASQTSSEFRHLDADHIQFTFKAAESRATKPTATSDLARRLEAIRSPITHELEKPIDAQRNAIPDWLEDPVKEEPVPEFTNPPDEIICIESEIAQYESTIPKGVYVGSSFHFESLSRATGKKSECSSRKRRIRILPVRYWCDRSVYVRGRLKGICRRNREGVH